MRVLVVAAMVTMWTPVFAGHKPAAVAVPPIEAELGASTPMGEATTAGNSTELRIGVHTASLYWKPTRFDVGIGYAGSYRELPSDALARTTDLLEPPSLSLHGLYFSLAYAIESHKHWRTWLGARVETMTGDYQGQPVNVMGGSVRLGAELFSTGVGWVSGGNALAFMAGAWALGVYVEGTARTLPDELGPVGVGAGVSMRVPFLLAVGN